MTERAVSTSLADSLKELMEGDLSIAQHRSINGASWDYGSLILSESEMLALCTPWGQKPSLETNASLRFYSG